MLNMKVLIATDGSKYADEAAAFVARLPHRERLDVTIVAVTPSIEIYGNPEMVGWKQRYYEEEKKKAEQSCERIERLFMGANVTIESVLLTGHVGTEITHAAKERKCDLVVVGALGHSTLERMMVGSVSDFVATHSTCSVLIVRPGIVRDRTHHDLNLCVAYDNSKPSKFALKQLEIFQWGPQTHLDIVSGFASPLSYSDIPMQIDIREIQRELEANLEAVAEEARKAFPRVKSEVIQVLNVGDSLVDYTRQKQSDVIVVGDTGNGLIARFLMGSVSRYVLRHAECSVWIARKPAE